jgi:hypothetical protein
MDPRSRRWSAWIEGQVLEAHVTEDIVRIMLMYFILPLWLAAGFADWLCHRASNIATTSGPKESVLHLLQFAEMAVPVLAALFLEINALIIAIMIVCLVLHEATAIWDVRYASATRDVSPTEQHIHSFLEMLPLMGLLMIIALHWQQFLALLGQSSEPARWDLVWNSSRYRSPISPRFFWRCWCSSSCPISKN